MAKSKNKLALKSASFWVIDGIESITPGKLSAFREKSRHDLPDDLSYITHVATIGANRVATQNIDIPGAFVAVHALVGSGSHLLDCKPNNEIFIIDNVLYKRVSFFDIGMKGAGRGLYFRRFGRLMYFLREIPGIELVLPLIAESIK